VALGVVAAERAERQQLPLPVDSFRDDDQAERMPELDLAVGTRADDQAGGCGAEGGGESPAMTASTRSFRRAWARTSTGQNRFVWQGPGLIRTVTAGHDERARRPVHRHVDVATRACLRETY